MGEPGRRRGKRNTPRRTNRRHSLLDQPLFVQIAAGLLLLFSSSYVGYRVWQHQKRVELASDTTGKVSDTVSKLLTGSRDVIAAHENHFKAEQFNQQISEYNSLQEYWDENVDTLELGLKSAFPAPGIQAKWKDVSYKLHDVDVQVDALKKYYSTSVDPKHLEQIKLCHEAVDAADKDLHELIEMMSQYRQPF